LLEDLMQINWQARAKEPINLRNGTADGLERRREAFIGMLQGKNFGKLIARLET
jgi:NADPH-dependent curcumin reductase CurA